MRRSLVTSVGLGAGGALWQMDQMQACMGLSPLPHVLPWEKFYFKQFYQSQCMSFLLLL